jgi:uncharacterized protein (DUF58 family)
MGDSPRRVDWKASSRSDDETDLVVREFAPERKVSVLVVADLSPAMEHPKTKAVHAHALVELFARSAFSLGGSSRIIGVTKDGIIASPPLESGDDILLFMRQVDDERMRSKFREPWRNMSTLLAEWKPKNTLVVFVSDLRSMDVIPINAIGVIDRVRQNIEFTCAVLDEWSGFVPSTHMVSLRHAESGVTSYFDLREGGELHRESVKFQERVEKMRSISRRLGMSVHTLPLADERPLAQFMRSWHKMQASRS